jgi:hypothetical protein
MSCELQGRHSTLFNSTSGWLLRVSLGCHIMAANRRTRWQAMSLLLSRKESGPTSTKLSIRNQRPGCPYLFLELSQAISTSLAMLTLNIDALGVCWKRTRCHDPFQLVGFNLIKDEQ